MLLVSGAFGFFLPKLMDVFAVSPPNIISYQGRLLNSNGVPLSDPSISVEFRLFDAAAGGTCLWSNSSSDCDSNTPGSTTARTVTLTQGLFSENLGDTGAAPAYAAIPDSVFADNASLFLEIEIAGEVLSPRKQVVATGFALNADTLDGIDSSGFLPSDGGTATGEYDFSGAEFLGGSPFVFEGSTNDGTNLTTFAITDPTASRTITFKDESGTVAYLSDIGAAVTLDDAYDNFGATASIINIDAAEGQTGGLEWSVDGADNFIVDLQSTGDFVIQDAGTGYFGFRDDQTIDYTTTANALIFELTANSVTTADILEITGNALTTGSGLSVQSSSAFAGALANLASSGASTGQLFNIDITNASAQSEGIRITNEGTGRGMFIDQNNDSIALDIDHDSGTGTASSLNIDANTWGDAISILKQSAVGSGIDLDMTGNESGSSRLIEGHHITTYDSSGSLNGQGLLFGRIYTMDDGGAGTETVAVNGDLLRVFFSGTETSGNITHAGSIASFSQGFGDATGDAVEITNAGTGDALSLDQNGNGVGLNVDSEATTSNVATLDGSLLTSGQILQLTGGDFTDDAGRALSIDVTETTETADIVNIQTNFGSANNNVFRIEADGEAFSDVGFTAGAFSTNYYDGSITDSDSNSDDFFDVNLASAVDTFRILSGNFQVGSGTPDNAVDGNDLYVSGASEFDGNMRLDGPVTHNGTTTFNDDVDYVFTADGAGSENMTITSTQAIDVDTRPLSIVHTNSAGTSADFNYLISAINADDGGATGTPDAIALFASSDTDELVADGVLVASGAGGFTDAFDGSDDEIVNALNAGENFVLYDGIRVGEISANVLTWEDTSGNDLMTLADAGATGDLTITGNEIVRGDLIVDDSATAAVDAVFGVDESANTIYFGDGAADPVLNFENDIGDTGTARFDSYGAGLPSLRFQGMGFEIEGTDLRGGQIGSLFTTQSIYTDNTLPATRSFYANNSDTATGITTSRSSLGGFVGVDFTGSSTASLDVIGLEVDSNANTSSTINEQIGVHAGIALQGTNSITDVIGFDAVLFTGGTPTATNAFGFRADHNISAGTVTDGGGFWSNLTTNANSYTNLYGVLNELSGSATVTTAYGSRSDVDVGTTRYGYYADVSGGTTNWAFYSPNATADSAFNDDVFIGAETESITDGGFTLNGDDAYVSDLLGVGDTLYVENGIVANSQLASGSVIDVTNSGTSRGLDITNSGSGSSIFVDQDANTGSTVDASAGGAVHINNDGNLDFGLTVFTGEPNSNEALVHFRNAAQGFDDPILSIQNRSAGGGTSEAASIFIDHVPVSGSSGANAIEILAQASTHAMDIFNDGNSDQNDGIRIQACLDTNPGSGCDFLQLFDGDGTSLGAIQGDGAGGVTNASTGADYAELFPGAYADFSPGDILALDGAGSVQLASSDGDVIGAFSVAPNVLGNWVEDWQSAGTYVAVALLGQVPINVNTEGGAISAGDHLTISSSPGVAMRLNGPGHAIGVALEDHASGVGQIEVYVNPGWHAAEAIAFDGTSNVFTTDFLFEETATADATTQGRASQALSFRGSGWNGSSADDVDMTLLADVNSSGDYRLSVQNDTGTEVAFINDEGDLALAGRLYPSDRGSLQTEKYIFYDSTGSPGMDYMRTNAAGWGVGSYDFAEMFPSLDELAPGEIVVFADDKEHIKRSGNLPYDRQVAGIVSTRPGFLAGEFIDGHVPVALAGRVPTYVTNENGAIAPGDPLTTSSKPGYAMKATEPGPIVGYAMEASNETTDSIIVYVNVSYYDGGPVTDEIGTQNDASGIMNLASLDMSGNLNMNGGNIISVGSISGIGNMWRIELNGDIMTRGRVSTVIKSYQNEDVRTYAVTSPETTIQLSGTAELKGGSAEILFEDIDPKFNDVISSTVPYRVFLTANGPTNALYAVERTNGGFLIKEADGSSDVLVDWLVMAYHKDFEPEEEHEVDTAEESADEEQADEVEEETPATEAEEDVTEETTADPADVDSSDGDSTEPDDSEAGTVTDSSSEETSGSTETSDTPVIESPEPETDSTGTESSTESAVEEPTAADETQTTDV